MLLEIIYSLIIVSAPIKSGYAVVASHTMDMNKRYGNALVNDIFKDNILLTLDYMDGKVRKASDVNWNEVEKPFHFEFNLNPGEGFSFHDKTLPLYSKNIVKTTNAHFNYQDGFKSDGYLIGDGVCHLASLIYWVAKDAGVSAFAPSNHDFANIPGVPKEYGVSIYARPDLGEGATQNLYIINNKNKPITFSFDYKEDILTVSVLVKN